MKQRPLPLPLRSSEQPRPNSSLPHLLEPSLFLLLSLPTLPATPSAPHSRSGATASVASLRSLSVVQSEPSLPPSNASTAKSLPRVLHPSSLAILKRLFYSPRISSFLFSISVLNFAFCYPFDCILFSFPTRTCAFSQFILFYFTVCENNISLQCEFFYTIV